MQFFIDPYFPDDINAVGDSGMAGFEEKRPLYFSGCKNFLLFYRNEIRKLHADGASGAEITYLICDMIDELNNKLLHSIIYDLDSSGALMEHIALVAVGGYGRGHDDRGRSGVRSREAARGHPPEAPREPPPRAPRLRGRPGREFQGPSRVGLLGDGALLSRRSFLLLAGSGAALAGVARLRPGGGATREPGGPFFDREERELLGLVVERMVETGEPGAPTLGETDTLPPSMRCAPGSTPGSRDPCPPCCAWSSGHRCSSTSPSPASVA